jgi:hypothetical protein
MELVDFLRIIYKLTTKYGMSGFFKNMRERERVKVKYV